MVAHPDLPSARILLDRLSQNPPYTPDVSSQEFSTRRPLSCSLAVNSPLPMLYSELSPISLLYCKIPITAVFIPRALPSLTGVISYFLFNSPGPQHRRWAPHCVPGLCHPASVSDLCPVSLCLGLSISLSIAVSISLVLSLCLESYSLCLSY